MSRFFHWVTSICAMLCGLILFGVALFGTVTTWWLPDMASHVLLALLAIGCFVQGVSNDPR